MSMCILGLHFNMGITLWFSISFSLDVANINLFSNLGNLNVDLPRTIQRTLQLPMIATTTMTVKQTVQIKAGTVNGSVSDLQRTWTRPKDLYMWQRWQRCWHDIHISLSLNIFSPSMVVCLCVTVEKKSKQNIKVVTWSPYFPTVSLF